MPSPPAVAPPAGPTAPRKYKRKQGTKSLREIRKYQKSTACLLQIAPFHRLAREITQDFCSSMCWKQMALEALQVATEAFLVERFGKGMTRAVNMNRTTLQVQDIQD